MRLCRMLLALAMLLAPLTLPATEPSSQAEAAPLTRERVAAFADRLTALAEKGDTAAMAKYLSEDVEIELVVETADDRMVLNPGKREYLELIEEGRASVSDYQLEQLAQSVELDEDRLGASVIGMFLESGRLEDRAYRANNVETLRITYREDRLVVARIEARALVDIETATPRAAAAPAPNYAPERIESNIKGSFEGFSGDTVFPLMNGQLWQQAEYRYHYHYAYMPRVLIYLDGGSYYMRVEGVDQSLRVRRLQ